MRAARLMVLACAVSSLRATPAAAQTQGAQEQLWDAAIQGDTVAIAAALQRGALIDSLDERRSPNGRRALNWAAWYNHPAAIRFLAARGATVSMANWTGFTPLHHAAENGCLEAARALLLLGADRSRLNAMGQRPVDVARERGHPDVAALLDSLPPN
jgi:E3 ubiquitin-protein ligase HECTD1